MELEELLKILVGDFGILAAAIRGHKVTWNREPPQPDLPVEIIGAYSGFAPGIFVILTHWSSGDTIGYEGLATFTSGGVRIVRLPPESIEPLFLFAEKSVLEKN